jgi:hypothetical protein
MDQRLIYSPEHYRAKLSAYAKDTIDFESFSGLFKYKINQKGNHFVVEELNGYFKVYVSDGPTSPDNDNEGTEVLFAKIYISIQALNIEVHSPKWIKILFLFWTISLAGFAIHGMITMDIEECLFMIFLLVGSCSLIKFDRHRYKQSVINFLNTLSA